MTDGDFGTGAYHPDCQVWEIRVNVNRDADVCGDEWISLREHVEADGLDVLYGAPEAVRARFGLVQVPCLAAAPSDAPAPASPCVGTCGLDDAGHCRGCGRTAGEIAGWRDMGDAEKRRVLGRLVARGVDAAGGVL